MALKSNESGIGVKIKELKSDDVSASSPEMDNTFPPQESEHSYKAELLEMLISILLYADDIVLLANSPENLQYLLDITFKWCEKWRLSINGEKTEIMHIRTKNNPRSQYPLFFGVNYGRYS